MNETIRQEEETLREDRADMTEANTLWEPFVRTGQAVICHADDLPEGVVWANNRYIVVLRDCTALSGIPLIWLSIKSVENDARHDWREFQRIKNELVGPEVEAVELYPAESRLVDNANNFHVWCFPGFRFPFGFRERMVSEHTSGVSQRPFDPDNRPDDLSHIRLCDLDYRIHEEKGKPSELRGRFPLGKIVATKAAVAALAQSGQSAFSLLSRHARGDWGETGAKDRRRNDEALQEGGRLLSVYALHSGQRLWIITESDRSITTILTPEEY